MSDAPFNPERLTLARQRAGLTQVALAQGSGVDRRSLVYFETGRRSPTSQVAQQLAASLDVPTDFLYAHSLPTLTLGGATFRALTKMSAGRRDAALTSGALALEVNRWLEERLSLPRTDVPRYERAAADPVGAARRLRGDWELGTGPLGNVVHLLEAHGVRVFSLPPAIAADVDAFSYWHGRTPLVLLNTSKSGERGRFDGAHELGHLVMHSEYDLPRGRDRELEANRFAAALLMPEQDVLACGLRNAGADRVINAKKRWGVAATALAHRLHELGLTSEWVNAATYRRLSQLGYRSAEPGGIPRETSQLLSKAFQRLRERNIGLPDVARELSLHPQALRELLFGLTPVVLDGGPNHGPGPSSRPRHLRSLSRSGSAD